VAPAPSLTSAAVVALGPDGTGPHAHCWEAGTGEATWDTAVKEDDDGNITSASYYHSCRPIPNPDGIGESQERNFLSQNGQEVTE